VFGLADITIANVRIETDAVRLVYVQAPANATGSFSRLKLINVTAPSESLPEGNNYIGSLGSVSITGVAFDNVVVGGRCLASEADARLKVEGRVSNVTFACGGV
jgi:hypothetical protein